MFTDTLAVNGHGSINTLKRRGVGKAGWKRVIDNLIFSEKEDMKDMATLRRLLGNNPEGLKLIAEMMERKAIRVMELNDLLRYSDKDKSGVDAG